MDFVENYAVVPRLCLQGATKGEGRVLLTSLLPAVERGAGA